jgi:hypothetical protein
MRQVIDYAGLFPPAGLAMDDAIAEYVQVRTSPYAWISNGFVVSADRLRELDPERLGEARLCIVISQPTPSAITQSLDDVAGLNVGAIELAPVDAAHIPGLAAAVPPAMRAFFEVPPTGDVEALLDAIAAAHASAKLRTGGVTANAFPNPAFVHRVLAGCAQRGVACKATAGLHHAIAGRYPLTYGPDSPIVAMYGVLNMCLAAVLTLQGADTQEITTILTETSATAFVVAGEDLTWRNRRLSAREVATARRDLFCSFGSCSFREPIEDLQRIGLL